MFWVCMYVCCCVSRQRKKTRKKALCHTIHRRSSQASFLLSFFALLAWKLDPFLLVLAMHPAPSSLCQAFYSFFFWFLGSLCSCISFFLWQRFHWSSMIWASLDNGCARPVRTLNVILMPVPQRWEWWTAMAVSILEVGLFGCQQK